MLKSSSESNNVKISHETCAFVFNILTGALYHYYVLSKSESLPLIYDTSSDPRKISVSITGIDESMLRW